MENNTNLNKSWIDAEQESIGATANYEKLPGLKMAENKITELTLDVSNKFETYTGTSQDGKPIVKAIIPVVVNGERMNWWLNKKNPVYHQLLDKAKLSATDKLTLKIVRTGQAQATKYAIVE